LKYGKQEKKFLVNAVAQHLINIGNPAVEEQVAGRAHRMGQKKVVQVIRMITQGTIEEKIYELQQSKKELIDTVVHSGDQAISKITEQEIREILSI
jgi:SNF2 family DNA or RNA helicase